MTNSSYESGKDVRGKHTNYICYTVSNGITNYKCDTLCPYTVEQGEEKLLKNKGNLPE